MSGQICRHEGWGEYPGEEGPTPAPAEMKGSCAHRKECPVCDSHVFMSCSCPTAPAVNYATAILGAHYEKRG